MSAGSAPGDLRRLHIDTDPGLDDLLAIALALASPEARVHSLSTVAGNAGIDAVTENAQRFLALAGADVPLGRGADGPLELARVDATTYHGADGRRGITIPAIDRRPLPTAAEVLRRALEERAIDRIVALGPLTNLACLLDEERGLLDGIEIIWMGGTLGEGNVTPLAEFNCYADPAAAARVLDAGLAVRVVGLEVTGHVHVRGEALPAGALGGGAMGGVLEAVLSAMMESEEPLAGERRATLHDPCALLAALPLDLFRWEEKSLSVVVDESHERGRMVENRAADAARPVRYAVEVNTPEIVREFWSRLAAYCGVELQ